MKISVVVPVFNGEKYIRQTLDSIFNQTYKNFQVVLMDGASKDNTVEIASEYPDIKIVSQKDKGQSDAINNGFKLVTGDILAWQNADDVYMSNCFDEVVHFFQDNPEVSLVYGYYQLIDESSNWICDVKPVNWSNWLFKHGRFCPVQPTVFWRRSVYESIGELNTDLSYCMDVDFYAKTSKKFSIKLIPSFLGKFRVHQESKTQNILNKLLVKQEYLSVLANHFEFTSYNKLIFNLFQRRASIASTIKRRWLKRN